MHHRGTNPAGEPTRAEALRAAVSVVVLLFVFLVGIRGLGEGFKLLGEDLLDQFFSATANPFIALMVGILTTTLVQSSSVTTSMVVGLVAAPENPLPLANAVPMIMGANIGTTVTNTIVSIAHMGRPEEFRRAFAVATCHDFFNFLAVLVLLPAEIATGFLSKTASTLADRLPAFGGGPDIDSPVTMALKSVLGPVRAASEWMFESPVAQGAVLVLVGGALIFGSLMLIVRALHSTLLAKAERMVRAALGGTGVAAILIGCLVTAMVQSSSITTSLLVPLAGVGLITLRQAFPVTIGANLGTTITALLATLAVSGPNSQAGVEIALTHLGFNVAGTLLIYPWGPVRGSVLAAVRRFSALATEKRLLAVAYLLVLFYGLPAILALLF